MTPEQEREAVRILGSSIGYGQLMTLASQLWEEHMTEKGNPISGVFVPVLRGDIKMAARRHYKDKFKQSEG